jgi:hypothetical protein
MLGDEVLIVVKHARAGHIVFVGTSRPAVAAATTAAISAGVTATIIPVVAASKIAVVAAAAIGDHDYVATVSARARITSAGNKFLLFKC